MTVMLRRRAVRALVAALGVALLVPSGPNQVAAVGDTRPPMVSRTTATDRSFSVATYNIRHALSNAVAVADIEKLAGAGADIIRLQELGRAQRRAADRTNVHD